MTTVPSDRRARSRRATLAAALGLALSLAAGAGRSEARRKARRDGDPDQFALEERQGGSSSSRGSTSIPPWCSPLFCWW